MATSSPGTTRPLADLKPGESGVIVEIRGEDSVRLRLMEMGLLEGEIIRVLKFAPLGDPMELLLRGYHLSLRKQSAQQVMIAPEDPAGP